MNNVFHVAGREYSENARTKGFWINLLMFPVLLVLVIKVPQFLEEEVKPVRHYVLVDQSGEFEEVIEREIERAHQRRVLQALNVWAQTHARDDLREAAGEGSSLAEQLEQMPAEDPEEMLEELLDANPAVLDALAQEGGLEAMLAGLRPMVRDDAPEFEEPRRMFARVPLPDDVDPEAPPSEIVAALRPYLTGSETLEGMERALFALVLVPEDAAAQVERPALTSSKDDGPKPEDGAQFWTTNLTDTDLQETVERALNREVREREYVQRGVDSEVVRQVERTRMEFNAFDPKKEAGKEIVSQADTMRKWAPIGFVYLLWTAIFSVVVMLLNNTVEEKSNRIIEVLLSSATPWEIMIGKLVGIAGVGMTMMAAWIVSMLGAFQFLAGPEMEWAGTLYEVIRTSGLLPLFVFYFVCGYLTFAGVFLAIGSLCNTVKEAQNFMGPATLLMMVPMFTMVFIAQDPHGTLAKVMTWIPIYTPFAMMNRAAADPSTTELVSTAVLMLVTIVVLTWLSSRVFRIGVLRTGQPPKLLELLRSVTTSFRHQ